MPVEMEDPDGDDSFGVRKARFGAPRRPWWRPAGTFGRALLAFCALIAVIAVGMAFAFTRSFLEHDMRFRIEGTSNIQATGLGEVSRAEMLPVFGEDIGRNIFFVPLSERRKQLEQIPWVEHATVMRLLPDQIRVSVVERQPVAFVRQGQQIGLVDANGVLLTMPAAMMAQHHYSFPVVTGIDAGDPLPSRKARMAVYLRMIGELDANGQHLSEQISEIDLTDPEDARVLMPEQGTDILAHFGEDHFFERYQRYKAHIAEWRQQYPKLAGVDLRYDQQVVLQMASGAAADQASVSTADAKPAASPVAETPKPDAATKLSASKPAVPAKPAAKIAVPKLIAKAAAPKAAAKPAPKHETAKANAPKPATKTTSKHEAAKVSLPRVAAAKKEAAKKSSRTRTQRRKRLRLRKKSVSKRRGEDAQGAEARTSAPRSSKPSRSPPQSRTRPTPPGSEPRTMSQKQDNLIVVLDIGSACTRVLAADLNEGALRYRGHGIVESAGMRKGLIADLGPAAKAVKAANEQAERVARANIDECVVGVGGPHIRGTQHQRRLRAGQPHARDYARRCAHRRRARARRRAPARSRDSAPAAAPVHPRRAAGHLRSRRHGRRAA